MTFGTALVSNQMNNYVSSPGRPRSLDITMNMCGGSDTNTGHANAASTRQRSPNAKCRKRKPSFSDDECMDVHSSRSSASPIPGQNDDADTFAQTTNSDETLSGKKRAKVGNREKLPLQNLLNTLEKPQLIQLVCSLIAEYPKLQADVTSHIPRPTLQLVQPLLQKLEKKLQNSFPYTKWGAGRDEYSFNRVKPTIIDIRNTLADYAAHFTSPDEFPTTTFTYLCNAVNLTCRLPDWDRPEHNTIKRDLLFRLAGYYRKAVRNASSKCSEGKVFGMQVVDEWGKNLLQHCKDAKHYELDSKGTNPANKREDVVFPEVFKDFVQQLGWMCSQPTLVELSQFANSI